MRFLRGDRAATDPILVIAAIAVSLVLLLGGGYSASAMIANGKDVNARADLDKVATAEGALAASGKSLASPSPSIVVTGTLPDSAGAASFNGPDVAVNFNGITLAGASYAGGTTWQVFTSANVKGSWTPNTSKGGHTFDTSGNFSNPVFTDDNAGITWDYSGVTKAAGSPSLSYRVVIPSAAPGFAPYLSGKSGNITADLKAGGGTAATALERADVGFTPSDGSRVAATVSSDGTAWAAVAKSATGRIFVRTSASAATGNLEGSPERARFPPA